MVDEMTKEEYLKEEAEMDAYNDRKVERLRSQGICPGCLKDEVMCICSEEAEQ